LRQPVDQAVLPAKKQKVHQAETKNAGIR
jgi:hypothetical protein